MASVTDDFNRANGGLGTNWTTINNERAPGITSNQVQPTSSTVGQTDAAHWAVAAQKFTPDQYAECKITALNPQGGPCVRCGSGVLRRFYNLTVKSSTVLELTRADPGFDATLRSGTPSGWTLAVNDVVRLEIRGQELRIYKNGVEFSDWRTVDPYITNGQPGIRVNFQGSTFTLDDFAAGDLTAVTPAAARTYNYLKSSSTPVSTTSGTVWSDITTYSKACDPSSTYYIMWSADVGADSTTVDCQYRVTDGGSTVYAQGNIAARDTVPGEYYQVGGIFRVVTGGAQSTLPISIQIKSETAATTSRGRYGCVVAIKGIATDQWIETTASTAPASGEVTVQTLTWTPPAVKDYLILGSAEMLCGAINIGMRLELHDTAGALVTENFLSVGDITSRQSMLVAAYAPDLTATSKTYTLRSDTTQATGNSVQNRRLLALDIEGQTCFYKQNRAGASTTGTTYVDSYSWPNDIDTANADFVAIAFGQMSTTSTTVSGFNQFQLDGTTFSEGVAELGATAAPNNVQGCTALTVQQFSTTGTKTFRSQVKAETAGTTVNETEMSLLLWQIQYPAAGITGTLTETEDPDTAAFTGSVASQATLSTTEAADGSNIDGVVLTAGVAPSYRSNTTRVWQLSTSCPVTMPAGLTIGDAMVLIEVHGDANASLPSATVPAGWTAIGSEFFVNDGAGFYVKARAWYKIASDNETGFSITWTGNANIENSYELLAYSGVNPANPLGGVTPTTNQMASGSTTSTGTSVTTTINNSKLIFAEFDWNDNTNDTTPPTGMTERADFQILYAADQTITPVGATGNKSHTNNSGSPGAQSGVWMFTLAPVDTAPTGTLNTSEAIDTTAATGTVRWAATLATTEAADAASMTGAVTWAATLTTTEAGDTAAATGTVRWAATLAEAEDPDVAALTGTVQWNAALVTTEAADIAALSGQVKDPISAALATTEAPDVALINGVVRWTATLATTEAPDTASLTGAVSWQAALATSEASDTAAFAGAVSWAATLGAIEPADTAAATATVRWAATLATTENGDTASGTGSVAWAVTLAANEAADAAVFNGTVRDPISAALTTTEAPDVGAFSGSIAGAVGATLTTTEGPDVAAFTGSSGWLSALTTTEAADVASFTGSVFTPVTGSLATTEAPDVAALTGTTRWAATLAASEATDWAALTGSVSWAGVLTTTEAPDTAALTGTTRWAATLAAIEPADGAAFNGTTRWAVTLAATEAADGAAITGGIFGTGTLTTSENPDAAALTGAVRWNVVLAASEAPDTYAGTGSVFAGDISVFLAATEAPDAAAFTGQVTGVAGVVAATEPADALAATGAVRWAATLAAVEPPDATVIAGTTQWLATLAVTEARDTAAVTGNVRWVATLAASEAPDTAAFTMVAGAQAVLGTLAVNEAPDRLAFVGDVTNAVVLNAGEEPDSAAFNAVAISEAILAATEAPDAAEFSTAPPQIQEAPGLILARESVRVRELAAGSQRVRSLKYPVPRPRDLINNYDQRMRDLIGRRTRVLVRD
jgi:hypothetical protein